MGGAPARVVQRAQKQCSDGVGQSLGLLMSRFPTYLLHRCASFGKLALILEALFRDVSFTRSAPLPTQRQQTLHISLDLLTDEEHSAAHKIAHMDRARAI